MAGKYTVIILAVLLSSCAQVGTISGGEKDLFAPKPIADKIVPPNESVNFNSNKVVIPFDEFIKLDNPSQNIRIVPPHANIRPSVKGKTLTLEWDETLQPSTTYSIYLNGAVKDITEGNDTVIQYVFSTGSMIDTFSYETYVYSAKKIAPVEGITLGLFDQDSMEIVNLARTDATGKATLNYLKQGNYKLYAFDDKNGNLEVDKTERVAFKNDASISISGNERDTVPMMLFEPKAEPKLRTFKYIPPGSFIVGATSTIEFADLKLNGSSVMDEDFRYLEYDSLIIYSKDIEPKSYELVLSCVKFTDTIKTRISSGNINKSVQIKSEKKELAPSDDILFNSNDMIVSVDTSKIRLRNGKDSTMIPLTNYTFGQSGIILHIDRTDVTDLIVEFDTSSVECNHGFAPYHIARLTLNSERKYGTLNVDLSEYKSAVLLEVYHEGKLEQTHSIHDPENILRLEELLPGSYSFRVIRDENKNDRWDTGILETHTQPERIDIYTESVKVRANWEVDVPLIPSNE